eukprot:CAMPEP_0167818330 /NCGR_PEP_ID=MMETSP0112_2-20121227/4737_1 /TAXON_ID=91324 /ORGANISM="Lotharella globosa, Strain CCCM811" /LENGTH=48 /DNA_ID= /DNA_START= /DNA_END= /DNA_ORIENTATION=
MTKDSIPEAPASNMAKTAVGLLPHRRSNIGIRPRPPVVVNDVTKRAME